jgi:undecaprenyl-diphosphatase
MLQYIILGIIQGIFEWLPISSEGVVAITSQLMKLDVNPINIAIFLHL